MKKVPAILNCFCKSSFSQLGLGLLEAEFSLKSDITVKEKVCYEWVNDYYYAQAYSLAISLLINGINFVLKYAIIAVINLIGEDERSA